MHFEKSQMEQCYLHLISPKRKAPHVKESSIDWLRFLLHMHTHSKLLLAQGLMGIRTPSAQAVEFLLFSPRNRKRS